MQYAVPQFTDVEDKLIGPLTLKQFLSLLAVGGVILFFWSILGQGIIFFMFAIPVALLGLIITFGKFNGRPFFIYLGPFMSFLMSPKARIYKRDIASITVAKRTEEKKEIKTAAVELEPAESRLRKLAYLLDQKSQEEKELIEKVK